MTAFRNATPRRQILVALAAAMSGLFLRPGPVLAGDGQAVLSVELNSLDQAGPACRVTFVAGNTLGADLEGVSLEVVTFGTEGVVQRMTVFDFGALPAGRERVRQFELSQTECRSIGRILVNGVADCKGGGLDRQACERGLRLSNKTDIEFIG